LWVGLRHEIQERLLNRPTAIIDETDPTDPTDPINFQVSIASNFYRLYALPMEQASGLKGKHIIRSQYFVYFGVMGVVLPYFNLYCYHLGFSGFEIGVLSAARSVVMVLFPLLWGLLADHFHWRRPIYILCNVASTLLWILYFYHTDFYSMLAITVLYGAFYAPIISFLEAFTMDVLGHEKKKYGRTRVWGSISFIAVVVVLGRAIDIYAINIIIGLVFIGSLIQAVISLAIPGINPAPQPLFGARTGKLFTGRAVVFLVCAFLMLVSHGTYYGFFSIHLENLGYDKALIGVAWALASSAEIVVMMVSGRIFRKFSLETVLLFSFMGAVVRWVILYFAVSPHVILMSQALHAFTYGTFHMASILYMDQLMPDEAKTTGQAVNNALTYGLGLMVGFFVNGYLYERIGVEALFVMSAGIALLGGALFWGFQKRVKQKEGFS
jgi:MFS transporter, PPP family, 3-phenylpropionic acid transporter